MDWLILILVYNPLLPLMLLGIMRQRTRLKYDRIRLATLHRVASGGGRHG